MILRGVDIKLNVRPVYLALAHEEYYEGPCRFGSGDALQPGFDSIMNQELFHLFVEKVKSNMPPQTEMLEPIFVERTDSWVTKEALYEKLTTGVEETDFYIINSGIGRSDIALEFAMRVKKPMAVAPDRCCEVPIFTAALKSRGYEIYAARTWKELQFCLKAVRLKKVLANTRVLLAPRGNSVASFSATDGFVSLNDVTELMGVKFRYINIHELLDMMTPIAPEGNHTTPGRKTPNLTQEDLDGLEELADRMIENAQEAEIKKEFLINSLKAYAAVKKNLDLHDCNAFTVPCPDVCSTRRINEMQFTFCLTHSLLNEQGIPSACEYDINALVSIALLEAASGKAAYMGNTNVLPYEDGKLLKMDGMSAMEFPEIEDKTNLYHTWHSVANRKLHGIHAEESPFAIRHFAFDQEFGAVLRYDFNRDAGQEITLFRFAPNLKKVLIGKGIIVAGGDYDKQNCNNYVIYRVKNQEVFFQAQMETGTHIPFVYGDYTKELAIMAKAFDFEVLCV